MARLEWSEEFSIGVPMFDDEHKELLVLANALDEAITGGAELARLRRLEIELFDHVIAHFRHEELFFADYPFAEEHAEHHAILLQRVATYCEATLEHPSPGASADMLAMLSDALLRHIAGSDKKLGAYLCATGRADVR